MRGQHFAMRVNIYARAFCLPEQFFKIQEIVPADEDGLALFMPK